MSKLTKIALGAVAGGILGYSYYYFIGCNSGSCAITSNWHISSLYGAVMGVLLAYPSQEKDDGEEEKNNQ